MTTISDHPFATRSDALIGFMSVMRLRDPEGASHSSARARSWLQALDLLTRWEAAAHDAVLVTHIDARLARFQEEAHWLQEQHPYRGCLPEREALRVAAFIVVCEGGSSRQRARFALVLAPVREAFIAWLRAPADAALAEQVTCLYGSASAAMERIASHAGEEATR